MPRSRVAISGAGVAGTVLAYWLAKHDFQVVVLERSAPENQQGQVIDVEGPALDIVTKMGLLDEVMAGATHEAGFSLVDSSNRTIGTVKAGQTAATKEIEIMRPTLAGILLKAAKSFDNVAFWYRCTIIGLQQDDSSVTIEYRDSDKNLVSKETFDFLVACDGLRSRTRDMILPATERDSCLKPIDCFAAFFNIPAELHDRPYARCYLASGRRNASMKPMTDEVSSVYLCLAKYDQRLHDARQSGNIERQKQAITELFAGAGWECDRFVRGMAQTKNFYFEELCQVKLNKWSRGRCVLLGDTAYAPSPLTGQGTNLAILGAYVLASRLVKQPQQPEQAFEEYEKDMRPYVNKTQPIPLWGYAPLVFNPETSWGIWLLRRIVSWATWLEPWKYLPEVNRVVPFNLPEI